MRNSGAFAVMQEAIFNTWDKEEENRTMTVERGRQHKLVQERKEAFMF